MNTKDNVLEVTFLLSLEHGFDNVSLTQIQDNAKITSGGLYYHFKDKNDILVQMVKKYLFKDHESFKEKVLNYNGSFRDKIGFIMYLFVGLDHENKEKAVETTNEYNIDYINYHLLFLGIYHQHPEIQYIYDEINEGLFELFTEMIEEEIAKGNVNKETDPKKATVLLLTILKGLVSFWINYENFPLDEIIEDNLDYTCKLLCTENM